MTDVFVGMRKKKKNVGVELGNQPHFLRFQNRSEAQDGADGETNLQASKISVYKKIPPPPS